MEEGGRGLVLCMDREILGVHPASNLDSSSGLARPMGMVGAQLRTFFDAGPERTPWTHTHGRKGMTTGGSARVLLAFCSDTVTSTWVHANTAVSGSEMQLTEFAYLYGNLSTFALNPPGQPGRVADYHSLFRNASLDAERICPIGQCFAYQRLVSLKLCDNIESIRRDSSLSGHPVPTVPGRDIFETCQALTQAVRLSWL